MSMLMVEKLCVFKVRHVYLFTSSSLSSMLCSTLLIVRYDSTAQMKEQREDTRQKRHHSSWTKHLVCREEVTEKKVVQSLSKVK